MRYTFGLKPRAYALAILAAMSGNAAAQDSTVVFAGGDFREDSSYGYLGGIWAFNRDLGSDGFLLRAVGAYDAYKYHTASVTSGHVDVDHWRGQGGIGYQWFLNAARVSLYGGVDYQNHDQHPNDPTNKVRGDETGGMVQGELETLGSPFYLGLIANYSTAFDSYWGRARAGYKFGQATFGPELVFGGNERYDEQRYGAFVLWPFSEKVNLQVSGGYANVDAAHGRSEPDSGYGSVGISFAF
jgi:hypothetical protein